MKFDIKAKMTPVALKPLNSIHSSDVCLQISKQLCQYLKIHASGNNKQERFIISEYRALNELIETYLEDNIYAHIINPNTIPITSITSLTVKIIYLPRKNRDEETMTLSLSTLSLHSIPLTLIAHLAHVLFIKGLDFLRLSLQQHNAHQARMKHMKRLTKRLISKKRKREGKNPDLQVKIESMDVNIVTYEPSFLVELAG